MSTTSTTTDRTRPIPPGEVLVEAYLDPRGITITDLASASGLSRKHVSQIINGHVGITAATAVRFARVFGTTPELWLNMQNKVDLYDAEGTVSPGAVRSLVAAA
jgi:antitoxin HigA-1